MYIVWYYRCQLRTSPNECDRDVWNWIDGGEPKLYERLHWPHYIEAKHRHFSMEYECGASECARNKMKLFIKSSFRYGQFDGYSGLLYSHSVYLYDQSRPTDRPIRLFLFDNRSITKRTKRNIHLYTTWYDCDRSCFCLFRFGFCFSAAKVSLLFLQFRWLLFGTETFHALNASTTQNHTNNRLDKRLKEREKE